MHIQYVCICLYMFRSKRAFINTHTHMHRSAQTYTFSKFLRVLSIICLYQQNIWQLILECTLVECTSNVKDLRESFVVVLLYS